MSAWQSGVPADKADRHPVTAARASRVLEPT
jgi:hypothetical protein